MMAYFFSKPVTVVIPLVDGAFFGSLQDGKFIRRAFIEREGSAWTEETIRILFEQAHRSGWTGRDLCLSCSFPDVRMEKKLFPEMKEEDLAESVDWEADRLFRTNAPLVMGWRILRHDVEGYEVLAMACREETLWLWSNAAAQAGKRIVSAVPPMAAGPYLTEIGGVCVFLGMKKKGLILFCRDGQWIDWQIIPAGEEGAAKLAHFLEKAGESAPDFRRIFLPMIDCEGASASWWQSLFLAEESMAGEEAFLSIAAALPQGAKPFDLALPEYRRQPLFSKENRILRAAQGVTAAAFLAALYLGGQYAAVVADGESAAGQVRVLAPVRQEMVRYEKEKRTMADMEKAIRSVEEGDLQWEQKLVFLGDLIPPGAAVQSISGESGGIRITGTADAGSTVTLLQQRLRGAWKGAVRVESVKSDPKLPLMRFSLFWSKPEKKAVPDERKSFL